MALVSDNGGGNAGMYPNNQTISLFGETISWPGVDPETGKFTNGDFSNPLKKPSFIPAETINLILDNLANFISALGGSPNNTGKEQLKNAIVDALAKKANLASPTFTGAPKAPTVATGTNNTQLATTAFVQAAITALINSSPAALDTLNELATALGNDPNFATTITNALALKANLASPSFTGTPKAPTAAAKTNNTQIATTAYADNAARPVKSYYIQFPLTGQSTIAGMFPSTEAPGTLFGGTWTEVFGTEDVFFRTGSTLGTRRGQQWNNTTKAWATGTPGIEPDAIRNATGTFGANLQNTDNSITDAFVYAEVASSSVAGNETQNTRGIKLDISRVAPTDTTNHPKNRLFKIWKRTA